MYHTLLNKEQIEFDKKLNKLLSKARKKDGKIAPCKSANGKWEESISFDKDCKMKLWYNSTIDNSTHMIMED